jgi:glycosyltransferase involved in cell wall biosynthesis/predicted SAM-dependent methyltransferase
MIVKNEEEVLARCLDSIKDFPDEIIIVDTGSTDKTKEIAAKYTSKIYDFEWCEDFSAARNFSFQQATSEYVLWLDADDLVLPTELTKLKALKQQNLTKDIYLMIYDYCQNEYNQSMSPLFRERMVKNSLYLRWLYPIHEVILLTGSDEITDITITHKKTSKGYSADLNRNIGMLEKAIASGKYPKDSRLQYYLAKEYYDYDQYDKAAKELQKFLDMNDGWVDDRTCAQQKVASCYLSLSQQATDSKKSEYRELAKKAALEAIKMDYRWAEPCYVLGTLALDAQDFNQAIYWYEQCRRPLPKVLAPLRPDYYTWLPNLQLCLCYNAVGDIKMAYERNKEALQQRPNDGRMLNNDKILSTALKQRKTPNKPVKLNLGSGNKRYYDYLSCDKYPGKEVDEVFSLNDIPYADNTVQSIHSEHALEHLYHADARQALKEWYRVLIPGGDIHLQLPDLEECCRQYLNAKDKAYKDWYRYTIYGIQRSLADEPIEGQVHHTGFSLNELQQELQNLGFVIDFIGRYDGYDTPSLEVRAIKPTNSIRIGWVYAGCALESPQYRIRVYHIDRWLRSRGYCSQIIGHEQVNDCDVLIFGRGFNELEYNRMVATKQAGKTVILDLCEYLFGFNNEWYEKMITVANMVICCSHVLADKVQEYNENVQVLEDAVESDFNLSCTYEVKDKPKVVFCGMGGHSHQAERLRPIIESEGFELVTIHEHHGATVKWGLSTWQQEVAKCDIGIAPCDYVAHAAKSNVKITSYMGFGIPTIASPLDAYIRVIKNEQNGFIVKTDSEWRHALHQLKDAKVREKIGRAGKLTAFNYHLDRIAERWKNILVQKKIDTTVDIIIPTYDHPDYLEECIKSIKECTADHPYNIIVIDAKKEGTNFSQSINLGIERGSAPYVCLLNDDTIVSKGWLTPLVEQIKGNIGLANPLSNCDKGFLHNYNIEQDGLSLGPGTCTLKDGFIQLKENTPTKILPQSIYNMKLPFNRQYTRNWLPFFCTVMSREVINKVGYLDEEFRTGSEDLDFCLRAEKMGYTCAVNENSWVFHFGGISRKAHEDEDKAKHIEEDIYNNNRIQFKYGGKKLIAIHTGLAWEEWGPESIKTGIGGSETAAYRMATELAKFSDNRVVIFAPCKSQVYEGVEWKHIDEFEKFISMNFIDTFVISRYPEFLEKNIRAKQKYLWTHDVHPMNDSGLTKKHIESGNLTAVFVLSTWHRDYVSQICGISKDKIIITGNGITL